MKLKFVKFQSELSHSEVRRGFLAVMIHDSAQIFIEDNQGGTGFSRSVLVLIRMMRVEQT